MSLIEIAIENNFTISGVNKITIAVKISKSDNDTILIEINLCRK